MAIIVPSVRNNDDERLNSARAFAGSSLRRSKSRHSGTNKSRADALDLEKSYTPAVLAILGGALIVLGILLLPPAHATSWPATTKNPATSCFAPAPHPD